MTSRPPFHPPSGCRTAALLLLLSVAPAVAATFTVTDTGDTTVVDGGCTLREAVFAVHGVASADCPPAAGAGQRIEFNLPGPGPHVITPGSPYPAFSVATTLDGLSQPGVAASACADGPLDVVIDGTAMGLATPNTAGLSIGLPAGGGSVIRGLVMRNFVQAASGFLVAIMVNNTDDNVIECNFLGTDPTGSLAAPNQMSIRIAGGSDNLIRDNLIGLGSAPVAVRGISVDGGAFAATANNVIRDNRIGTNLAGAAALGGNATGIELLSPTSGAIVEGNLVSGGGTGISVSGSGTTIRGNRIGTNAAGTAAIPNSIGVSINFNAANTLIGTDGDGSNDVAERNQISGNAAFGVLVGSPGAGTRIAGNWVGVDATGNGLLGNGSAGVFITGTGGVTVGTNGDGSGDAVEGNVIGGSSFGVLTSCKGNKISGNHLGVGADGVTAVPNLQGVRFSCLPDATFDILGTDSDGVSDALEGNVISGNTGGVAAAGVRLEGSFCAGNRVAGNIIGLDRSGTIAVPNAIGVWLDGGAHDNLVGTDGDGSRDAGERNIIAGNAAEGVKLEKNNAADVYGNRVAGNWIGLAATGNLARPNGGGGVTIHGARDNVIGSDGVDAAEANVILGHATVGVSVQGATATGNRIAGNSFGADAGLSVVFPNATAIQLAGLSQSVVRSNLVFASTTRGIEITTDAGFAGAPAQLSENNCVVENVEGARKTPAGAPLPVFENNWWGAATGPNTAGADTAFDLDTTPFLVAAPAGCPTAFLTSAFKAFHQTVIPLDGTTVLTVTLANPSGTDTATAVSFSDTLPNPDGLELTGAPVASGCGSPTLSGAAGGVTFGISGATIAPRSTCTVQVGVKGVGAGSHDNTITDFTSTLGAAVPTVQSSNTATLEVTGLVTISKTNGVASVAPGGTTVYTIAVANPAGAPVAGAEVSDPFPADLDCSWICVAAGGGDCAAAGSGDILDTVDLPTGSSVTYTATCGVDAAATGTISNTATVTLPDATSASATDEDALAAEADVSVTKTDGVTAAVPGGSVIYTIVVSNAGPSAAPSATLGDPLLAGCASASYTSVAAGGATGNTAAGSGNLAETLNLPAGSSVTYSATCSIAPSATGTLSNTATVAAGPGVTDPQGGNDQATDEDALTPEADLAISKTDGVTLAVPGGAVTYTIVVSNAGPSHAPGSVVGDTFPPSCVSVAFTSVAAGGATGNTAAGSGNIGDVLDLPVGSSVTYTATCSIAPSATGALSNTATVAAGSGVTDPQDGNDQATDEDGLSEADLRLTKTDGVTSAAPGTTVTYTIGVSNAGPSAVVGASVTDNPPPACVAPSYTSVASGGATGNTAAGTGAIADLLDLPVGASVTYAVACPIDPEATGDLANTATIDPPADVSDPSPDNATATDVDTLTPRAALAIAKSAAGPVQPGGTVIYTVTASNAGPSAAHGALVSDPFDAALTCAWTCAGQAGGSCSGAGSGDIADLVDLPPGSSVIYTATCDIAPERRGVLANTASVEAPDGVDDPGPDDNEASVELSLASVVEIPTVGGLGLATLAVALGLLAARRAHRAAGGRRRR